jgi:hypothetical protein
MKENEMRDKKCEPPPPVLASGRGRDSTTDQAAQGRDRAENDRGQDLKSFAIWDDFLPPKHEDYMHGCFWSLGDDASPVDAVRHAKLLVSPRPLIAE